MQHFALRAIAMAALSLGAAGASAHIGYGSGAPLSATSRDFGTVTAGYTGTVSGRTLTSNFGWADASDQALSFDSSFATTRAAASDEASWALGGFTTGVDNLYFGDSHKGTAFRFSLASSQTVTISLTGVTGATGATGGALTPAFSVYKGLAAISPFTAPQTSADYDFSVASRDQRTTWAQNVLGPAFNYLATQGNWNAMGNWYTGGDGDPTGNLAALSFMQYAGSAASTNMGGTASATLTLGAGDYTIYVGGNDLTTKNLTNASQRYGFDMTVSAVPEPQAWLLMLAGLPLLALLRRRAPGAP